MTDIRMAFDLSLQSFLTFGTVEGEFVHHQTILSPEKVLQYSSNRLLIFRWAAYYLYLATY